MHELELTCVAAGLLLLISILSSKISGRFGIPALLLFLMIGMLAGSEGLGGIPFSDHSAAQSLGVTALVIILFSGGLDTEWSLVRPVVGRGLALATIGVIVTATVVGLFTHWILGLSITEGLLLGTIVSSTDAAAVLSVLRTQNIRLNGELQPLLELESGSNDPMAVFLTVALSSLLVQPSVSIGELIVSFFMQMILGAVIGYMIGRGGVFLINRLKLEILGLYPLLTLALAFLTFGGASLLKGNGFLAVYIAGLVIGNGNIPFRKTIARFNDGFAWLMQIIMFLTLGLLIFPSHLGPIVGAGLAVAAILIFVARPASVLLALSMSKMKFAEKLMVAWVGLRGAVPIILATFPLLAGVPKSSMFFNMVFFIVLVSILLQGTTIPMVAGWLRVGERIEPLPHSPLEFEPAEESKSDLVDLVIPDPSPVAGKNLADIPLPTGALVVLLRRADEMVIPNGETVLQPGDIITLLLNRESLDATRAMIEGRKVAGTRS